MKNEEVILLNTAGVVFAIFVAAVLLFQWAISPAYKENNAAVLETIASHNHFVQPAQLEELIKTNQLQNHTIVDLRTNEEFNRGSLPGAINIPLNNILDNKSLKIIRKSSGDILLISSDESHSAIASALLKSKGLDNTKVVATDYNYIRMNVLDQFQPASAFSDAEKARFDFQRYFRNTGSPEDQKPVVKPKIIQTEIVKTKGGC